ncbi:prolipoprotein diacylglyceryl transferase [bacterium]|nr:prolipoprotein diacylglyceryl transferase [bacterium]
MTNDYISWDINPVAFRLFGLSIRYYSLLFLTGFIVCFFILNFLFKKEEIRQEKLEKLVVLGIVGILIGSRLGHCLFYEPVYYLSHPLEMFLPIQTQQGGGYRFVGYRGLASHGGALGLFIALLVYCKITQENILKTLDIIAIVGPIEAGFVRLGNLMNSEIIGKQTSVPWAFIFERVDNIPRHPSQLYEALAYFSVFVILIITYKKYRYKVHSGFYFGLSIFLIFLSRFIIEFFKDNQVEFEENMLINMGQMLSIPFILVGLIFVILVLHKSKEARQKV